MSSVMENFKTIPSQTSTADENAPVSQPTTTEENAIPKEKKLIRCDLCGRTVNSEKQAQAHLSGLYHLSRMQARGLSLPTGTDLEKLRQYNAKAMRAMKATQGGIVRPPAPGPNFYNRRAPPPPPQFEPRMPGSGMSMSGMPPPSGGMPTAGMPPALMNSYNMTPNAPAKRVMCDICGVTANSPTQAQSHLEGRKHLTQLVELGFPLPPGVSAEFLEATSASMRQRTNFEAPKMQIQERFTPHHRVPQFQTPRFQYSQPHGPRMYPFRQPNAMMNNAPFHNGPAAGPRGPLSSSSYPMRVRSFIPCEVCQLLFNSDGQAQAHFNGSKHQKKVRMVNYYQKNIEKAQSPGAASALKQIICPVCSTTVNSDKQMDAHVQGKLHKSKLEQKPGSEEKEEEKASNDDTEVKTEETEEKAVTKSYELANCVVPGSALNPGIYQQQQQHFSGTDSDGTVAAKQSI